VPEADARALDACLGRRATLKLYAHLTLASADAGEAGKLLAERVAQTCLGILRDVAKGGLLVESGARTPADLLKVATTAKGGYQQHRFFCGYLFCWILFRFFLPCKPPPSQRH
jgi:hypothetical protein